MSFSERVGTCEVHQASRRVPAKEDAVIFTKRYHYTEDELFRWALDDLVIDLRCAIRDGLTEYAAKVREETRRGRTHERQDEARANYVGCARRAYITHWQ